MIKSFVKVIGFLVLAALTVHAAEIQSAAQAVDIAGKQRMYTQRMLKDYAMIGMGNTFGNPKKDLKETVQAFEENLKSLQAYAKSDATKQALATVASQWKTVKKMLLDTPSVEKAPSLQEQLEALLKAADNATKSFSKDAGKKSAKIIDIAGRQRMLSQRMAGLYMLKVWGVKDPKFKKKLDDTLNIFKASQRELEKASINTDESKKLLAKVKRSFMFFEMMNRSKSKFVPSLIYKKSNDILKMMNDVTHIYVQQETK